jgi:hypothetical protein
MFVNSPSNAGCDSDERVDLPPNGSECLDEWIVFLAVFIYVCVIWESITAICECNELYDNWWGWLLVGAPRTHSMYDMSLAKHVHGVVGHIHWSSHGGIVLSCGLEFWLPTFIRV